MEKLSSVPLIIYSKDSQSYVRHANLPPISVMAMEIIESQKLIVLLASGENALYLVNYETCKDMVKVTELVNQNMFKNENLVYSGMQLLEIT